ncbi:MAG: hypothetical protein ACI9BC_003240, partial [Crocinitomicaceae bacterium]
MFDFHDLYPLAARFSRWYLPDSDSDSVSN